MLRSAFLWYQAGTSDKVYHLYLEKDGELASQPKVPAYRVRFEYGRRGKSLRTSYKCVKSQLAVAEDIFEQNVTAQLRQGYKPYSGSPDQPQLTSVRAAPAKVVKPTKAPRGRAAAPPYEIPPIPDLALRQGRRFATDDEL